MTVESERSRLVDMAKVDDEDGMTFIETVGALREKLDDLPDDMHLSLMCPATATIYPVNFADVVLVSESDLIDADDEVAQSSTNGTPICYSGQEGSVTNAELQEMLSEFPDDYEVLLSPLGIMLDTPAESYLKWREIDDVIEFVEIIPRKHRVLILGKR